MGAGMSQPAQPGVDIEPPVRSSDIVMDRGRKRRASVFEVIKSKVGTSDESRGFWPFFQAACALYGAILFWVGMWSIMDDQINAMEFGCEVAWDSWKLRLKDIAIGTALLLLSDTYYQVGFVYGSMFPPMINLVLDDSNRGGTKPLTRCQRFMVFAIVQFRVIAGLTGSVFIWNGVYNSLYLVFPENAIMEWLGDDTLSNARLLKLSSFTALGLLIVGGSGTLLTASGVPHVLHGNDAVTPAWGTPLRVHAKATAVSTLSTVGQAFTWFGLYELTMTW